MTARSLAQAARAAEGRRMALSDASVTQSGAARRRRSRAMLHRVQPRRAAMGAPGVFSSLMLLGAAGLLTTFGIFLTTQLAGPRTPNAPSAVGGARHGPSPVDIATPSPDVTQAPADAPVPYPTARVVLLPTPTPGSPAPWCAAILGWSHTLTDHVCPSG